MKLIVGLGNPGELYRFTRHNIGYRVIDYLAHQNNIPLQTHQFKSLISHYNIAANDIILIKPETFMNLSGEAVSETACFYHLTSADIIVIHDDIDLEFGRIKIKTSGGSGGHLGIESIISCLETDMFIRIRVGIGRSPQGSDATEFVLQHFNDLEQTQLVEIIKDAVHCLFIILNQGTDAAMNMFHKIGSTASIRLNRVGGGFTPSVLSHHRTYGSVYGGS